MLNTKSQETLLRIAREAIATQLDDTEFKLGAIPKELKTERATFITLTKHGDLRGCIGSLTAHRPLAEDVAKNAVLAAFDDPRFPPLTEEELPEIRIEISVLTPPRKLDYSDADDLLAKLQPGKDGVILAQGWQSATYLPQVWEDLLGKEEFLSNLCAKAGLPPDAWRSGKLEAQTYAVEKFEESDR